MLVFLDFEASSLGKRSYPIEVGWVFEDGRSQSYLIRPAETWTDWDVEAEAIHGIARSELVAKGVAHDEVARQMVEDLSGHDLAASAPSWDGKWLSTLLRAAGLPRHSLRLRDSDDVLSESALTILAPVIGSDRLEQVVADVLASTDVHAPDWKPAHRALADAEEERSRWIAVKAAAQRIAAAA
ncbi:transcriptional regulator [Novosphingobium sp. 9U]|uniref:3'-5' exonuclease n=1 Tax=Novosphingobium sp. 9U TaxID=2653158 RepID=UPI0012EF0355|nr:transcriptional regulator [Novosphingobium sp. 9U]VWX46735.1 Transcriptional regulator [Novosphingobium sp. 9U]